MTRHGHPGEQSRGNTASDTTGKKKIRQLAESGQLQKAKKLAQRACKKNREDAENWFILGTIYGHMQEYREAAECCRRAIALHPDVPMAHYNLGIAQHRLGEFEDAIYSFNRACTLQPDFAEAFHDLGHTHLAAGNAKQAVECYLKATRIRPSFTAAHYSLVQAHLAADNRSDAISCLKHVLALHPGLTEAHFHLGNLLADTNRPDEAIDHFQQAIRLNPGLLEARLNLGNLLQSNGRAAEAITLLEETVQRHPDSAAAHYNLGNAYRSAGKQTSAEAHYHRAIELEADLVFAHINLGLTLQDQGKWSDAVACFEKAVALSPEMPAGYSNLAYARRERGEYINALEILDQAIERLPDAPELHWDRSLLWLLQGDFSAGWREYEWRWEGGGLMPKPFSQPRWEGSDLTDKTVLVWSEQGIGDEIMFASCYPDLVARAGHVIIDCEPRLVTLFRRSFPAATVHGATRDDDMGWLSSLPPVDYQVPAGSLPLHFRPTLDSFGRDNGYLRPDRDVIQAWRKRHDALGPGLKIGISWRGGHVSQAGKRSTTLDQWQPVLRQRGKRFINLQYGSCKEELESFESETGLVIHHWPESDPLHDLDGFAAQIAALDLVISVDNSTVHMAGAVGTPVWVLQPYSPDWRWQANTDTSYWYPSLRQFRQPIRGDWAKVFELVVAELSKTHGQEPA
jgi:tetratricopeptide (TPR) repeat protein